MRTIQPKGERHPKWRGGKTITKKGYVRLTAGPDRGKYEHRVIAEKLWLETYGTPLPKGFEVHHMDFVRSHNWHLNLLILGPGLHEKTHCDSWPRKENGKFCGNEPDWVTEEVA